MNNLNNQIKERELVSELTAKLGLKFVKIVLPEQIALGQYIKLSSGTVLTDYFAWNDNNTFYHPVKVAMVQENQKIGYFTVKFLGE